jgi:hypothetical protein
MATAGSLRHLSGDGVGLNIKAEPSYRSSEWPDNDESQSKMMRMELLVEQLDAAVSHAIDLGATEATHQPPDRDSPRLRVMLGPAGHPFRLFVDGE